MAKTVNNKSKSQRKHTVLPISQMLMLSINRWMYGQTGTQTYHTTCVTTGLTLSYAL